MRQSPLSVEAIRSTLATQALGHRLELFGQIDSTNREAFTLAQADVAHGTVVIADTQTAGRGRLARTWFSPPGVNLYCSVVLRRAVPDDRLSEWLSWLPLAAALAAAEAVESFAGIKVSVKWPNDLLIDDRKIGGILCESGSSARTGLFQVIGIGINVNGSRADFPSDIREAATTIAHEAGRGLDRNGLLVRLLHELEACVEELSTRGHERISTAYSHRCATLNRVVRASLAGGEEFIGLAEAIGPDGSLQVTERSSSLGKQPPQTVRLRVADIIHLRSGESTR